MKIVVAAYACNPYGGSEPGVGWAAVCRIARNHEVFVITDIHNREGWERGRHENKIPPNVHVRFLREHSACSQNRFVAHVQSWLNYASFNRQILSAARSWHEKENFDLCHQVTIAGWRMPSPLWQLPIPFIWGPIGGAGYIPRGFRSMLSPAARAFELLRDINSSCSIRSSAFRNCIQNTSVVFAANEETEELLRPHRGDKPLVRLPIASISPEKAEAFQRSLRPPTDGPLRLFAGGNMEGRKGISIALRALAKVAAAGIDFQYTVAGGGPEVSNLVKLARQLGLERQIEFHPGFSGADYLAALHRSDVYFLPSFRESTPVTLLEAYLAGCYPVVADTSAQGEIVRMAGGSAVPVTSMKNLIEGLSDAILDCACNREKLLTRATEGRKKLIAYFDSARYDQALSDAYLQATESLQTLR
ncbi:glycosyltransferase family 4 protein [Luteolibacter soli]|uniref:Glycosyltransferase family 4 protein n=1 Tax=Luteolibacter soli TaxID=3135280 RepID=A0ABU9AV59_9BACT